MSAAAEGAAVHVFAGPTIDAAAVMAVLPGAEVHPPVAAGDLLELHAAPGDVVVVLDGVFHQSRSVRHKELLELIGRGVTVWGASSMGALRGAEMRPLGMRAHGRIARLYSLGLLTGDDEVAVLHGDAEAGWRSLSEALVNVRATLRRAVRDGALDRGAAGTVLAGAAALPYEQRRWEAILHLEAGRLGEEAAEALRPYGGARRVDLKRLDAESCLVAVARSLARPREQEPRPAAPRTLWLDGWLRSARPPAADGALRQASDDRALSACRLLAPDYAAEARSVVVRTAAAWSSAGRRMAGALDASERRAELARLAPEAAADPDAWRRSRRLSAANLDTWLGIEAVARRLRDGAGGGDPVLLAAVRADAEKAGLLDPDAMARWLAQEELAAGEDALLELVLARAWWCPPGIACRGPLLLHLKATGRLEAFRTLATEAAEVNSRLHAEDPRFSPHRIRGERVIAHFRAAWGEPQRLDLALLDRHIWGPGELVREGRELYAMVRTTAAGDAPRLAVPRPGQPGADPP